MNRRTLLRVLGAGLTAGAAGCLASSPANDGDAGGSPDGSPSATPTPTDARTASPTAPPSRSPTPVGPPELVRSAFELLESGPGTRVHDAAAEVEDGTVIVTGTIPGANGCYTADLASVEVRDGTLVVVVESFEAEPKGTATRACTQAIVAIDYRAAFEFSTELPTHLRVVHDAMGERTTVLERELSSTGETPTATGSS